MSEKVNVLRRKTRVKQPDVLSKEWLLAIGVDLARVPKLSVEPRQRRPRDPVGRRQSKLERDLLLERVLSPATAVDVDMTDARHKRLQPQRLASPCSV